MARTDGSSISDSPTPDRICAFLWFFRSANGIVEACKNIPARQPADSIAIICLVRKRSKPRTLCDAYSIQFHGCGTVSVSTKIIEFN